jgi:hypothetical protein
VRCVVGEARILVIVAVRGLGLGVVALVVVIVIVALVVIIVRGVFGAAHGITSLMSTGMR